jgi:2-polyprenyl-3-methyl-5-hydroxy-6-metoxy-1,4-benzoquinol methylase
MERSAWLKEKRRMAEMRMDTMFAATYDDHWGGYINATHAAFVQRLLGLCPPGGAILDAACSTGKYWPMILASGRSVTGIDQSREMLKKAQAKHPDVAVEKIGLQEMRYQQAFDGLICMDAMEFVFPEDWPLVVSNFQRALKSGGHCYFTVEIIDEHERLEAFAQGKAEGLPLVEGEYTIGGGYHYYPPIAQARQWTMDAGFTILDEAEGDGYYHFLTRNRSM